MNSRNHCYAENIRFTKLAEMLSVDAALKKWLIKTYDETREDSHFNILRSVRIVLIVK